MPEIDKRYSAHLEAQVSVLSYACQDADKRYSAQARAVDELLQRMLRLPQPPIRAHLTSGAPYLPEHPDVALSISHTRGYVAALIAPRGYRTGIDIERYRPQLESVRPRYLRPQEEELLQQRLPSHSTLERLALLWAAKEAAFKALQPASGSLHSSELTEVIPTSRDAGELLLTSQEAALTFPAHYHLYPDYVCCWIALVPSEETNTEN